MDFERAAIWSFPQVTGLAYVSKDVFSVSKRSLNETGLAMRNLISPWDRKGGIQGRRGPPLSSCASCGFCLPLCVGFILSHSEQDGSRGSWYGNVHRTKKGFSLLVFSSWDQDTFPPEPSVFPSLELTRIGSHTYPWTSHWRESWMPWLS